MSAAGAAPASDPLGSMGLIDTEAEQIVLGSILRSGTQAYALAADIGLESQHFGIGKHAFVYETATRLITKGREPNLGEIADTLTTERALYRVDGITGLLKLEGQALAGKLSAGFARKVKRNAQHRIAYGLANEMRMLIETGADGEEVCRLAGKIQQTYLERSSRTGGRFAQCLEQIGGYDVLLSPPKNLVPAPFKGCIPGFAPGQLITVGGNTGMGKTIYGCHAAIAAARARFRTLLVSLEMGIGEILRRWLSMTARVRHDDIRLGTLDVEQRKLVMKAGFELDQIPLEIVSEPNTLEGIGAKIMRAKAEGEPYRLVIIDYLGLINVRAHRLENRVQEVSFISRSLKELAMTSDLPVLALAQLNRAHPQRKDPEPQLSDLKESGSIEQDSDVVAFVHRPEYYAHDEPMYKDKAELIVRKQRNGSLGRIEMLFFPEYVSFDPLIII